MLLPIVFAHALFAAQPKEPDWISPSPGLRIDRASQVVEFQATACLSPDPSGRVVDYLELFVCSWDSREHESLLATDIKPSQVHAALLLAGAKPGRPAEFVRSGERLQRKPAEGSRIRVSFIWTVDGTESLAEPHEWVSHAETDEPLSNAGFVFAGSQQIGEKYAADTEGTLISLVVFDVKIDETISRGVETLAWVTPMSHEAAIDESVWIANPETYPPRDTPVTVRLKVVQADD